LTSSFSSWRSQATEEQQHEHRRHERAPPVILDANPLDGIANTRKIFRVVTNGRVFDPRPLRESVGFLP
jgi:hypothetical protein